VLLFFFSSRRRHTRSTRDWSSDVCSSDLVLTPQVLAIEEIVARTENMLRRLIGEDIELTFVSQAGLGSVRGDPGQIEQVLVNLRSEERRVGKEGRSRKRRYP